jgi:peptide/nickel transport system substrate-binding protein
MQQLEFINKGMRSMTVRRIRTAAATAAILTGVAACSAPASTGSGEAADSVVIGVASEPDTLSPLLGYGKDGNSKIFDGLLARDAGLKLRPALAKALPDVAADGLTYTYTLRDGVKFSDGKPLSPPDTTQEPPSSATPP